MSWFYHKLEQPMLKFDNQFTDDHVLLKAMMVLGKSFKLLLITLIFLGSATQALAQFAVDQTFTGATAAGWILGNSARLTAAAPVIDPVGSGWLRLTSNAGNQKGHAYFDTAFPTPLGFEIDFEYASWGGSGADGITMFLFDGSTSTFQIGDFGGALGYCQGYGGSPGGLSNAYLGIALDEFGNFSSSADRCTTGGPGVRADAMAIRGPGNGATGYNYLAGTASLTPGIDSPGGTTRPLPATYYRRVSMVIQPNGGGGYQSFVRWMTVQNGTFTEVIAPFNLPSAPPATLKIGFASSTGGSTNVHEIRNVKVSLRVDLQLTKTSSLANASPSDALSYTLNGLNTSGFTVTGAVLTDTVPNTVLVSSWTCSTSAGGTCSSASGSTNNISLTLTLPANGTVTIIINGIIQPSAAATTIINTASLSPPTGIGDINTANNNPSVNTIVQGYQITGVSFIDANHNLIRDNTEGFLPSITITLSGAAALSTTTNASGVYTFGNLPVGNYSITQSTVATYVFTTSNPRVTSITQFNLSQQNFGNFRGAKVTGNVFKDDGQNSTTSAPYSVVANANNAIRNSGEQAISSAVVQAISGINTDSSTTNANGDYTLWIEFTWTNPITIRHELDVPTGKNIGNTTTTLATTFGDTAARSHSLTFSAGSIYTDYNFGIVPKSVLLSNQSAQIPSPGSVVFSQSYRPGTLGNVNLTPTGTSNYSYLLYLDSNCDGTFSAAERASSISVSAASPTPSFTVDANWQRTPDGQLKACQLEFVVRSPTARPAGEQTFPVLSARLLWGNNPVCIDLQRVQHTLRIGGSSLGSGLGLSKLVRNVTTGGTFSLAASGKPTEILEYCVLFVNNSTGALTNLVIRDQLPFFTTLVSNSLSLTLLGITTPLSEALDADVGEVIGGLVTVRITSLVAGQQGQVCYRASIQ
jgi:uncharacterized repeat protein (TIGR01451 family)